jgi:aryl-alcohol dehydrogenase-like predicted oxidoreductase
MTIPYTQLTNGYRIPKIIKGNWQLSDDHSKADISNGSKDMLKYAEAGFTTFDLADIYTGVEEIAGLFLKNLKFANPELHSSIHIHTKYVPNRALLPIIKLEDTIKIIDRSLQRLGVDSLDMVQFHWWDYEQPKYIETLLALKKLQTQGKIKNLSVTNFDVQKMEEIINADINLATIQLQYSILDNRPEKEMLNFCLQNDIKFLCYGVLAGGFLTDKWLGKLEPLVLENRSLEKYKLIVDDTLGWIKFQKLLRLLRGIADLHNTTIANVATKYILQKQNVAAVILGSRNVNHLDKTKEIFNFDLSQKDIKLIDDFKMQNVKKLDGDCYYLERNTHRYSGIMKYDLNSKD